LHDLIIGRTAVCLKSKGHDIELAPIHNAPDDAGLIGRVELLTIERLLKIALPAPPPPPTRSPPTNSIPFLLLRNDDDGRLSIVVARAVGALPDAFEPASTWKDIEGRNSSRRNIARPQVIQILSGRCDRKHPRPPS
jgi:hypothetical protein